MGAEVRVSPLGGGGAKGTAADMTLADVVRLNFYARDVDELFKQFSTVNERFGDSRYATTVLGAGQLPARFVVMLEATAVD